MERSRKCESCEEGGLDSLEDWLNVGTKGYPGELRQCHSLGWKTQQGENWRQEKSFVLLAS